MSWVSLTILSAFFLGFYEISRKTSLKKVKPFELLFYSSLTSAIVMTPFLVSNTSITFDQHLWLALKSLIICFSWGGELFALFNIPLSLGVAVRSSAPLLTIVMALTVFGEMPAPVEWLGISFACIGYFQFGFLASYHRRTENLRYRWLILMFGSTVLGVISGGIDRHLLKNMGLSTESMQIWFSIYTALFLGVPFLFYKLWKVWKYKLTSKDPELKAVSFVRYLTGIFKGSPCKSLSGGPAFSWSWGIPLISVLLLLSDKLYFTALADPLSSLAVVFVLRRSAVIISVIGGGLLLKEERMIDKSVAILFVFIGLVIIKLFGS